MLLPAVQFALLLSQQVNHAVMLVLQANAVSDKLLDLRSCVYTGKNLADKVLAGALVADADFSNTVMSNVTLTKSYAKATNFSGMLANFPTCVQVLSASSSRTALRCFVLLTCAFLPVEVKQQIY